MNQATSTDAKLIEWLNKLIMLAQWDKKLPFHLVTLVSNASAYEEFRTRVASGTADSKEVTDQETPVAIARKKLLAAVASVPTLKELFAGEPDPFKNAPPDHLQLLAEVSDITVKPPQIVYSRNGTLIAVVEALRQSQEFNAEPLIVDGLNKFFTLIETRETVAKMLFELAKSPNWYTVLASLREDRDYTREDDSAGTAALRQWQGKLTTALRELLFRPGHLSRAPKKLIEMAWTHRELFDEARQKIPADARAKNDEIEERRQVTNEALALFAARATPLYDGIKADLSVLATVARHYIDVRKFAKLDGFVYTWPEIARAAMSNYSALKYVEDLLVQRKPLPTDADPDAQDLYKLCEKNDRLIRFLRLRPYFSEINENELRSYQPLAPVVVTDTPPAVASARGADVPIQPQVPVSPPRPRAFAERYLTITVDKNDPVSEQGANYIMALTNPEDGSVATATATFSAAKLLERILGAMGITSDAVLQEVLKELFSSAPTLAESRMARGGTVLAKELLRPFETMRMGDVKPTTSLSHLRPLRLVVSADAGDIFYLPWEWLTTEAATLPWLSSPDFSCVRSSRPDVNITEVALYPPVRILSIFPDPPPGERPSSGERLKMLEGAATLSGAQYRPLIQSQATLNNIQHELETFSPHIVHFEGYFAAASPEGVVRLVLSQPQQPTITVEQFADMLTKKAVQLLVLGKNTQNRIYDNTSAAAAFILSRKGVPAIIAPMRAIDEQSTTIFTNEFYTAFLKGNPLEDALHIARRMLASVGGDWSVFALFADPSRLDDFQLREMA